MRFKYTDEQCQLIAAALPNTESSQEVSEIVFDLETGATIYKAMERLDADKTARAKLRKIAKLASTLEGELSGLHPYDIGLGVEKWTDPDGYLKFDRYPKHATAELAELSSTLKNIKKSVELNLMLVEPNASKRTRNGYLAWVLQIWLNAGGNLGGGNSPLAEFFGVVCRPILQNHMPTSDAVVKFVYAWCKDNAPLKIKP